MIRVKQSYGAVAFLCVALFFLFAGSTSAQPAPDPRYRNRVSDCRYETPPGRSLSISRADSGISSSGYTAQQLITMTADASRLSGGEITICTEYGRVEIVDPDDDRGETADQAATGNVNIAYVPNAPLRRAN